MLEVLLKCGHLYDHDRITRYGDINFSKGITVQTQQHENTDQIGYELTVGEKHGVNHCAIFALFSIDDPHGVFSEFHNPEDIIFRVF